jgi:hypothetical protein
VAPSLIGPRSGGFRRQDGESLSNTAKSCLIPLSQARAFLTPLSDVPEMSFVREGAPDREPGDLVAGRFDGAFDLLLLGISSFE